MKILIVGGVAGGASAAARLRRLDENSEIIILERGRYISYANCGLPYYIGDVITNKNALTLQTPDSFNSRFNVDVRIENEVVSVDSGNKTVHIMDLKNNSEYSESYDALILSPGAKPLRPEIKGMENIGHVKNIFTLRNIPDTYKIKEYVDSNSPKSILIIGGGYIGLEMAENLYKTCGASAYITIIQKNDHVLNSVDRDMASEIHRHIKQKGINLILSKSVERMDFSGQGDNFGSVNVFLNDGTSSSFDMIIISAGILPDTDFLRDSNIELSERGFIKVNEYLETNIKNIYAAGDAVQITNFITGDPDSIPLAGPANKQGRIIADNIAFSSGIPYATKRKYNGTQGTSIIKLFDMTIASTGINESAVLRKKYNYEKIYLWALSHAPYYPGASNMTIKVLFEVPTGKLLGAQIVGLDGTDKRIDVLASAIRNNLTAYDLTELELSYAPPYSSARDPVNIAGFMIENILTEKVKQYHYSDIEKLLCDNPNNFTFLDVRNVSEFEKGHIKGAVNIPLDTLRTHLYDIDINKPVYVNCQSGLRSYLACRILSQKGFDCYNLAGGYRLYSSIIKDMTENNEVTHPCGIKIK